MALWVPPAEFERQLDVRQRHLAELLGQVDLLEKMTYWNKELRQIDPDLQLVKANEDTRLPELRPGYWHVLRRNAAAPVTVIPVQGPNGEYREPDSSLFEELRRGDMWSNRSEAERKRTMRKLKQAEERQRDREREERIDEAVERLRSKSRLQVAF